jgi:hypothetical protein
MHLEYLRSTSLVTMADYWNSVKIVNADISGNTASAAESSSEVPKVAAETKMWENNDDTTVTIGNRGAGDNSEEFKQRARELMPPFYKTQDDAADEETLEWEALHRQRKKEVRQSNEYKFAMLIAGAANMKIERIWSTESENPKGMRRGAPPTNESGDSFLTPAPAADDVAQSQLFQHRWSQVPEISMEIHLSPQVYFQVQESLNMIQKHPKAKNTSVRGLIREATMRTLFAGLVAINLKFSNFLSGLNYQLDANYKRLKRERTFQILRIISHIKKNSRSAFT